MVRLGGVRLLNRITHADPLRHALVSRVADAIGQLDLCGAHRPARASAVGLSNDNLGRHLTSPSGDLSPELNLGSIARASRLVTLNLRERTRLGV
jgi:hypothetical protein